MILRCNHAIRPMGHFAGRFPHTISPCFFTQGAYGMAYRNSYRLPLQEGRKCLALSRPSDGKPAHLKMDITQNRLPGQRKAHFYNMQGWEGQTVSREIAKTAKKATGTKPAKKAPLKKSATKKAAAK